MGLKRNKNRQTMPHHIQILNLNELKWNYDTISKQGRIRRFRYKFSSLSDWILLVHK